MRRVSTEYVPRHQQTRFECAYWRALNLLKRHGYPDTYFKYIGTFLCVFQVHTVKNISAGTADNPVKLPLLPVRPALQSRVWHTRRGALVPAPPLLCRPSPCVEGCGLVSLGREHLLSLGKQLSSGKDKVIDRVF